VRNLGDVSGIAADVATLSETVLEADLPSLSASVGTLGANVDGLKAMLQGMEDSSVFQVDAQAIQRIEEQLGIAGFADADTLFGNLAGISYQLDTIGATASDASKKAQTARTEASKAARAVSDLKGAVEAGDLAGVMARLGEIKRALGVTQTSVDDIPKLVKMAGLYEELEAMTQTMAEFAASKGFPNLLDFSGVPEEKVGEPGEGEGPATDPDAVLKLNQSLELMKGSMEHLRKLVDEKVYEPVVTEIYLPGAE